MQLLKKAPAKPTLSSASSKTTMDVPQVKAFWEDKLSKKAKDAAKVTLTRMVDALKKLSSGGNYTGAVAGKITKAMSGDEALAKNADFFKTMSDETRLRLCHMVHLYAGNRIIKTDPKWVKEDVTKYLQGTDEDKKDAIKSGFIEVNDDAVIILKEKLHDDIIKILADLWYKHCGFDEAVNKDSKLISTTVHDDEE